MRALYVTPMKSPDDPVPSGDRTIARAAEKMLKHAGFAIARADHCTSFLASPDAARMDAVAATATHEVERIAAHAERPDLVFTYHCYYKAPDLIGPKVAAHFGVPYVIAEASHAPKRATGAWARWHESAEAAFAAASLILVAGPHDRAMLERCVPAHKLCDWPPFIDDTLWPQMPRWSHRGSTHLLAVAMMRAGDKTESYRLLADALSQLAHDNWQLTIVGDGPARNEVLGFFEPFGARIHWRGALQGMALADAYADADLLVWPAVNEALGMVFLEAALQSCPSLACKEGGVAMMVRDGETGCLVPPRDTAAFAAALDALIGDPDRLAILGQGAHKMAQGCTLDAAATRLRTALAPLGLWP